jgi:S1-C subfamily serine protease
MNTRNLPILLLSVLAIAVLAFGAVSAFAQQDPPTVNPPFIGIRFAPDADGVRVTQVLPDSPAAAAGLQVDDVITAVDGEIINARSLVETIHSHSVGDTLTLSVVRADQTLEIAVTLSELPFVQPRDARFHAFSFDSATQAWTVERLSENSPLYEAGLRQGDVITAFNGETYDLPALMEFISGLTPDSTVTLTVQRGEESLDIEIPVSVLMTLAVPPMMDGAPFGGQHGMPSFGGPHQGMPLMMGGARLGVGFVTLDEQTASQNNLTVTEGALITEVVEGSPAAEAGLQVGDIVTAVDGDRVDFEHTLRDRLFAYEPGDTVTLDVLRDGETLQIQVTLGEPQMGAFLPFPPLFGEPGPQQPMNPPAADAPAA